MAAAHAGAAADSRAARARDPRRRARATRDPRRGHPRGPRRDRDRHERLDAYGRKRRHAHRAREGARPGRRRAPVGRGRCIRDRRGAARVRDHAAPARPTRARRGDRPPRSARGGGRPHGRRRARRGPPALARWNAAHPLFTDGALPEGPPIATGGIDTEAIRVGETSENAGIVRIDARRGVDPGRPARRGAGLRHGRELRLPCARGLRHAHHRRPARAGGVPPRDTRAARQDPRDPRVRAERRRRRSGARGAPGPGRRTRRRRRGLRPGPGRPVDAGRARDGSSALVARARARRGRGGGPTHAHDRRARNGERRSRGAGGRQRSCPAVVPGRDVLIVGPSEGKCLGVDVGALVDAPRGRRGTRPTHDCAS